MITELLGNCDPVIVCNHMETWLNTVKPPVSDHPKCQDLVVVYQSQEL